MGARGHKPTKRGTPPPTAKTDFDDAPTEIYESGDHGPVASRARSEPGVPNAAAAKPASEPIRAISMKTPEQSQPIQAISMKTPADPNLRPVQKPEREMPHVKLRAMSEVARAQQPQNLGNLAAPYDPSEARKRTMRELVVWGCLVVMIASGIALGVWLVAT